mmetsp:Transcript_12096/g.34227  ORF Transcript_12096/g.34227 Transcript_12096/m.34227 type:complete len:269 (+) Transcript_12096:2577-3383(+)
MVPGLQIQGVGKLAARAEDGRPLPLHEHPVHGPLHAPRDRAGLHGDLVLVVHLPLEVQHAAHDPLVDALGGRGQVVAGRPLVPVQPLPAGERAQDVRSLGRGVLVDEDVRTQDYDHARPRLDEVRFHVLLAHHPQLQGAPARAQEVEDHELRAGKLAEPLGCLSLGELGRIVGRVPSLDQHPRRPAYEGEAEVLRERLQELAHLRDQAVREAERGALPGLGLDVGGAQLADPGSPTLAQQPICHQPWWLLQALGLLYRLDVAQHPTGE